MTARRPAPLPRKTPPFHGRRRDGSRVVVGQAPATDPLAAAFVAAVGEEEEEEEAEALPDGDSDSAAGALSTKWM